MELLEAINKATQVLDEERSSLTVQYSFRVETLNVEGPLGAALGAMAAIAGPQELVNIRTQRPRQIVEDPRRWQFKSVNYDLLSELLARIPDNSRPAFLGAISARLGSKPGCSESKRVVEPRWNRWVSEFPLVAEFCIRNGAKDVFLQTLPELTLGKARYLYLKGALLEGINLEVNQDKAVVESFLKSQGFSDALVGCLNHADQIYQSASSGFEFKTCMGHLRSFMEKLHSEAFAKLQIAGTIRPGREWGMHLNLLHARGLLTKTEEAYVSALYTLLCDEGVHPSIAEKECARLARNVVIEYALLFLRKLEKLGHP